MAKIYIKGYQQWNRIGRKQESGAEYQRRDNRGRPHVERYVAQVYHGAQGLEHQCFDIGRFRAIHCIGCHDR